MYFSIEHFLLVFYNYDKNRQAEGHYSEILIQPKKFIPDPFRQGNNIMCFCESLDAKTMAPIATNTRADAASIFSTKTVEQEKPWYGIEQEYTLMNMDGRTPLGWPTNGLYKNIH